MVTGVTEKVYKFGLIIKSNLPIDNIIFKVIIFLLVWWVNSPPTLIFTFTSFVSNLHFYLLLEPLSFSSTYWICFLCFICFDDTSRVLISQKSGFMEFIVKGLHLVRLKRLLINICLLIVCQIFNSCQLYCIISVTLFFYSWPVC